MSTDQEYDQEGLSTGTGAKIVLLKDYPKMRLVVRQWVKFPETPIITLPEISATGEFSLSL